MPLDHMKITARGSRHTEIWPLLHFTRDKPSSSSTAGIDAPKSTRESLRDLSRLYKDINVRLYHFILNEKQCIGIQTMNKLAAL